MIPPDLQTSCVEHISSVHGKQRRLERSISIRDLQIAVKYGTKTCQPGEGKFGKYPYNYEGIRYKFVYDGIVYITDDKCEKEITCFSTELLPLEKTFIDESLKEQITEQRRRISTGESQITSHTVIIVDQSSSMNKCDVVGHRTRTRGAFYTIASEMVAKPLLKDQVSYTDVVSVIEMRDDAELVDSLLKEPFTWELYNKLVDCAHDTFRGRGHGNYLPALEKASRILKLTDDPNCALLLIFVSDGAPSDPHTLFRRRLNSDILARRDILQSIESICLMYKERLTVGLFGFANDNGTIFEFLKEMKDVSTSAGAFSLFSSGLDTENIRKNLLRISTSLLRTRSNLSSMFGGSLILTHKRKERTDLCKDNSTLILNDENKNQFYDKNQCRFHYLTDNLKRLRFNYGKDYDEVVLYEVELSHPEAKGIAVKINYLEKGAERFCFDMIEVDENQAPIGQPLVGKLAGGIGINQREFHIKSAKTQLTARRLARKFNEFVREKKIKVIEIEFLDVCFYSWGDKGESLLSEKRLDISRYKKFNDNKGGVHNLTKKNEIIIGEEKREFVKKFEVSNEMSIVSNVIIDEDIPQAFSHWTYQYTKRELLVCDLQGTAGKSQFTFTDPAIHSTEPGKYGGTDHGDKGKLRFFETHVCNSLCKRLGLHMKITNSNY